MVWYAVSSYRRVLLQKVCVGVANTRRWEIRVDKCVSKNIFIGVSTSRGLIENYVGSNRFSWGYLANKAIWFVQDE